MREGGWDTSVLTLAPPNTGIPGPREAPCVTFPVTLKTCAATMTGEGNLSIPSRLCCHVVMTRE